jgi:hypothetical protein
MINSRAVSFSGLSNIRNNPANSESSGMLIIIACRLIHQSNSGALSVSGRLHRPDID